MTEHQSNPDILLVEDNPGDVRLTQVAFRAADFAVELHITTDGLEAMEFLRDEELPSPDLMLLDLNLPRKDGFGVIEEIRDDRDLECLPVLVLSSSTSEEDISSCYEKQANAYLTKPDSPDSFVKLVQSIEKFWVETVRLPPCSYVS